MYYDDDVAELGFWTGDGRFIVRNRVEGWPNLWEFELVDCSSRAIANTFKFDMIYSHICCLQSAILILFANHTVTHSLSSVQSELTFYFFNTGSS